MRDRVDGVTQVIDVDDVEADVDDVEADVDATL